MKTITLSLPFKKFTLGPEQLFMVAVMVVNGGNYIYNLMLGRILGPEAFADAALLITLLLILSFLGMTFQIVTTKYAVLLKGRAFVHFLKVVCKCGMATGLVASLGLVLFSNTLQNMFNTQTFLMFMIFGAGLPLYFLMSINRGIYQGRGNLTRLSATYMGEMMARLSVTFIALLVFPNVEPSIIVASGIAFSILVGVFPLHKGIVVKADAQGTQMPSIKPIATFLALTAFYELTQIVINNSDILLVKYYFNNTDAGLYASLALIGRIVYFITWMLVMLLLPKVIKAKSEGQDTRPLLLKYVAFVLGLATVMVFGAFLFPTLAVRLMFGPQYLAIAPLLWQYALATSLFALSNIFAYYFLSTNKYLPVVFSAVFGGLQIGLIIAFHNTLQQVVTMQVMAMAALLAVQLAFFFYRSYKNV